MGTNPRRPGAVDSAVGLLTAAHLGQLLVPVEFRLGPGLVLNAGILGDLLRRRALTVRVGRAVQVQSGDSAQQAAAPAGVGVDERDRGLPGALARGGGGAG